MIFEAGSKVVAHRPGDNQVHDVLDEDNDNDNDGGKNETTTPRQRDFERGEADASAYETPYVLRTKRRIPPVQAEYDTEAQESETEKAEVRKRQKRLRVSPSIVQKATSC